MASYPVMNPAAMTGGYGAGYGSNYPTQYGGGGNPFQASAYNANMYGYGGYGQQSYGMQMNYGMQQPPNSIQMPYSMMCQQNAAMVSQQNAYEAQMEMYKSMGVLDEEDLPPRRRRKRGRKGRRRYDDDDEEDEEEIDEEEEKERLARCQAKLAENEDLKEQMKQAFIDEMLRRQSCSGDFELNQGTVVPFEKYEEGDPVVDFYMKDKGEDICGEDWCAEYDASYMRWAMKGMGTNEDAVILVVATRCNAQRQEIKKMFKTLTGRDIIEDLISELSGDFREAVMACFVPPAEFDAWSVKEAIYGLGTDEEALIEILMTRTNAQIREMKAVYGNVASPSKKCDPDQLIEKDIREDTSGDFKRLLISACQGNRYEISRKKLEGSVEEMEFNNKPCGMYQVNYEKLVDVKKAKAKAAKLHKAGEERWGTDEETFISTFAVCDYYMLRRVYDEYVKISQRDILNSVDREMSGDFKHGLRAIVTNIKNRPLFFAERLVKAMKGLGTNDKALIRIIVSRSEIDLVQIKKCFLELTKQTLSRWIKDDCSGDYKKLLQTIVGEN